jgi:hypothetical protein
MLRAGHNKEKGAAYSIQDGICSGLKKRPSNSHEAVAQKKNMNLRIFGSNLTLKYILFGGKIALQSNKTKRLVKTIKKYSYNDGL